MKKFVGKILDTWIDEEVSWEAETITADPTTWPSVTLDIPVYYHSIATSAGDYRFRGSPSISPSLSPSVSPSGSPSRSPSPTVTPSVSYSDAYDDTEDKLEEIKRDIRKFLEDTLGYYSYTLTASDQTNINNFLRWYLSRLYGRREIQNGRCGVLFGNQVYIGLKFPDDHKEYFLRWNVYPMKGIEDATVDGYAPPTLDAELEELFKWEE